MAALKSLYDEAVGTYPRFSKNYLEFQDIFINVARYKKISFGCGLLKIVKTYYNETTQTVVLQSVCKMLFLVKFLRNIILIKIRY